jgi:hypothetical protein
MAEFVNGDDSILSILRSGSYKPVACLTSNGPAESLTFNEVQTKCDPGIIQSTPNAYSYTKSLEGILTDTTSVGGDTALASWDYLKGLMRAKTLILWKEEIGNPAFITEYGEGYFAPAACKLPTIGHPFIFKKMEPQPRNSRNKNVLLPHVVMGFDVNLQSLIQKKDGQRK